MNVYKKIRIKLLKQFLVQINMRVALSTKSRTHYETLGISPNATHNEIKSAYYKLTLKYHPDKNKSESAKYMFQKISDAYNVLGNYKSRKQYDRSIAVRHGRVNIIYKPVYKQDNTENDTPTKQKIYDFDEWTRAHYQRTLENDLHRIWLRKRHNTAKSKPDDANFNNAIFFISVTVCAVFAFTAYIKKQEDHDIPINERKK